MVSWRWLRRLRNWWLRRKARPALASPPVAQVPRIEIKPDDAGPYRTIAILPADDAPLQNDDAPLDLLIVERGIVFCQTMVRQGVELLHGKRTWIDSPVHRAARTVGFARSPGATPIPNGKLGWATHRSIELLATLERWCWAIVLLDDERRDAMIIHFASFPGATFRIGGAVGPHKARTHDGVFTWEHFEPVIRDLLVAMETRTIVVVANADAKDPPEKLAAFVATMVGGLPHAVTIAHRVRLGMKPLHVAVS